MTITRRLTTLGVGLLAGAVATISMMLMMVAGREWLGVSPPPEAIPDRFAPTLDIDTFFGLFGDYVGYEGLGLFGVEENISGYDGLKIFGVETGIQGLVAVGLLVGLIYPLVAESRRARAGRPGPFGISRAGVTYVAALVFVLWVATVVVLWPVLDANFRGLPPIWARPLTMVSLLVYYAVGYGLTLLVTYRLVAPREALSDKRSALGDRDMPTRDSIPSTRHPTSAAPGLVPAGQPMARRAVVAAAAGAALFLPTRSVFGRLADRATFGYDGIPYSGPGVQFITPNDQFYSVTKNVVDPNPTKALWRLEVDGHVDEPRRYTFDDIAALPAVDQLTTLMCISNQIGAGLFSNAAWRGVPMRDLLEAAGVREGAREVLLHGADAYTDTFPIETALEPTTLVAYEMNGEPLPRIHGYPVRVIVPGYFGEKNVKWVTRIEVVDYDAEGFYEQQGWGPNFLHPTRSDIFAPRWRRSRDGDAFVEPFPLGETTTVRGRAFAGDRGVSRVEVSVDGGTTWREARIDEPGTDLTWTFWSFDWRPIVTGEYVVTSRATDGNGDLQTEERRGIVPQGATGRHRVVATVVG